jgi:hypothetical protein
VWPEFKVRAQAAATFSFTQIKQIADQCGARMIFTGLTRDVENAFRATRFISDDTIMAPSRLLKI